jgi:hypothetical protein
MLQQRVPTPEMQAAFRQKVMHLFGSLYESLVLSPPRRSSGRTGTDYRRRNTRPPLPWLSDVAKLDRMVQLYVQLCLIYPELPRPSCSNISA